MRDDLVVLGQRALEQHVAELRGHLLRHALARLALVLNVSVDYLLGLTDQQTPYPRGEPLREPGEEEVEVGADAQIGEILEDAWPIERKGCRTNRAMTDSVG